MRASVIAAVTVILASIVVVPAHAEMKRLGGELFDFVYDDACALTELGEHRYTLECDAGGNHAEFLLGNFERVDLPDAGETTVAGQADEVLGKLLSDTAWARKTDRIVMKSGATTSWLPSVTQYMAQGFMYAEPRQGSDDWDLMEQIVVMKIHESSSYTLAVVAISDFDDIHEDLNGGTVHKRQMPEPFMAAIQTFGVRLFAGWMY